MSWLSRIAAIVRSRKLERDLDEELQLHIELKTQENIAAGMPPEEADMPRSGLSEERSKRRKNAVTPTACAGWKTSSRTSATAFASSAATPGLRLLPSSHSRSASERIRLSSA